MKKIISLILIVFVSNKIFLENNINNEKFLDINLQQSGQNLPNQLKIYAEDIINIVNNITSNIMDFFQKKINDELYTILNTKAYPYFINILQQKSYNNFITALGNYLTNFLNNIKEYNYTNITEFIVSEVITNFTQFVNDTKFNPQIEKIIEGIKKSIKEWDVEEIRKELNNKLNKLNNINVSYMVDDIKTHYDYKIKHYKERDERSKIRMIAENYAIPFFAKTECRRSISEINNNIKSEIESFKVYINSENFLKDISGIDRFLSELFNKTLPILKEIEGEKVISVLKFFFSTIDNTLKSKAMKEIKQLIKKIVVENKSEYLLDEFLLKIYDVIETILNMKFFEDQNAGKIYNKLTEILNWAVEYLKTIDSFEKLQLEFNKNVMEVVNIIKEYDAHYVIDINTRYARRIVTIVLNYGKMAMKIISYVLKYFDSN